MTAFQRAIITGLAISLSLWGMLIFGLITLFR
jgi:hypothetical protein